MALASGDQFGSFTVLGPLGKGGMGEVYRARDAKLGRDVALKILPAALLHDPEHSARFTREARLLASLDHPNIGAIYGLEEAREVRALVLALVEGPTLADRLRSGPLPIEEASAIARQIAEAIEYAHERGVIHRDLKPANVKITPEGVVKVLDFGLAKALTGETAATAADPEAPTLTMGATQAGMIMGTAAYMSPEQARGLKTDRRSDIWSFGVVLYEMLTGQRLFAGQTVGDILAGVIKEKKDLGAIPARYRTLIARCIDKDPRRRLQAIGEARIVLENGGETLPSAPSAPRRTLAWAVAGLLAIALGLALWSPWRAEQTTQSPLLSLSVDLGPNALAGTNTTAAISLDGRRLVYPVRGVGGQVQLALRLLDQAGETMLPGTEGGADPFFSPDGLWVGFFANSKLKKISVQGGAPVTLADAINSRGGTWSADGTIVAALSNVAGLEMVSSEGGATRILTRLDSGESTHRWPRALPGGEAVLFTNSTSIDFFDDAAIEVAILKTGERKKIWQGGYFGSYAPWAAAGRGHLLFLRGGAMFGIPFDAAGFKVQGTPVPLLSDVGSNFTTGGGQYDMATEPGALAYWAGSGTTGWQVSWLEREGSERIGTASKMIPIIATPYPYYSPRFSHDGTKLAFSGLENQVYVSDLARGTATPITFDPQSGPRTPAWTPDDKHIVFRESSSKGGSRIGWLRATGGEPVYLRESPQVMWPLDFSRDGKRLLYSEQSHENSWDLWMLPLDLTDPERPKAGQPERLLGTSFWESAAAISPDGRWIAYNSNESGRHEVISARSRPRAGHSQEGVGKYPVRGGSSPGGRRTARNCTSKHSSETAV